jgi:hypothetical protein
MKKIVEIYVFVIKVQHWAMTMKRKKEKPTVLKKARALQRKSHIQYVFLFWELRWLSTNFHIHVSVSDLYIPRIGPHISCSRIGKEYIKCSQTHECGNWECGRAIPFMGIFVSNFWYCFFAVWSIQSSKKIKKFGRDRLQSLVSLMASSYMYI